VADYLIPEQRAIRDKRDALRESEERRVEQRIPKPAEPALIFDPAVAKFVPPLRHTDFSLVPRRPAWLAALSMFFASLVAIDMFWMLDFTLDAKTRLWGANIDHAILIAALGGFLGLLVIPFVRKQPRLLAALTSLEGATLSAAVVLVGLDGATYKARISCAFMCFSDWRPYTSTHHLWHLYLLWGIPAVVLFLQALRVLLEQRRPAREGAIRAGFYGVFTKSRPRLL
jgi:hypothetical protein